MGGSPPAAGSPQRDASVRIGTHLALHDRWHLHDEYARHVGHTDLLREAVDGLVGEDPPQD